VQPEKLAGTEFSAVLGAEDVAKGLYRLNTVYGQPFGTDKDGLRLLANEWLTALAEIPPAMFASAITDWIATEKKWPRPSDIRDKSAFKVGVAAIRTGTGAGVHERRLQPVDGMLNYPYMRSKIRANKRWADFLDSVHPTVEHNYFVEATFGEHSAVLEVPNEHRKEFILAKYSERFAKHFGKPVAVRVNKFREYDRIPRTST